MMVAGVARAGCSAGLALLCILLPLGCLEPEVKAPVGAPCAKDVDCMSDLCLDEADGFPDGYCSTSCDSTSARVDLRHEHSWCGYVRGRLTAVATCSIDSSTTYSPREGYRCAGTDGVGRVLPLCTSTEDCRGCACSQGKYCSFLDGWTCAFLRSPGNECMYGSTMYGCRDSYCLWDASTGAGRCRTEDDLSCLRDEDCYKRSVGRHCTATNTFVMQCDRIVSDYHYFEPCWLVPASPTGATVGICQE